MALRVTGAVFAALALALSTCSAQSATSERPTSSSLGDISPTSSTVDRRTELAAAEHPSEAETARVDFIGELAAADLAAWQVREAPSPVEYGGPSSDLSVGPGRLTLVSGVTVEVGAETPGSRGCQLLDPQQQGITIDPAYTEHQRCLVLGAFVPGTDRAAWLSAWDAEYFNGRLRAMWITSMRDQMVFGQLLGSSYMLQLPRAEEVLIGCADTGAPTVEVDGVALPAAAAYVATIDPASADVEAVEIECLYGA